MTTRHRPTILFVLLLLAALLLAALPVAAQPAGAPVVTAGYEATAVTKAALKYRALINPEGLNGEEGRLGDATFGSSVTNDFYRGAVCDGTTGVYGQWNASNAVTFTYDPGSGLLTSRVDANPSYCMEYNIGALGDLNYLQIDAVNRATGTTVDFKNVFLNGHSLGDFSGVGWSTWQVNGLDFSSGFTITGDLELAWPGVPATSGQETNKLQLTVGYVEPPPPPVTQVVVTAVDSLGNPLENVKVIYGSDNGGYQTFGVTDATGSVARSDIPEGTSKTFYVGFDGDNTNVSPKQTITVVPGLNTVNFATVKAEVLVRSCSGQTPLEGAKVVFGSGSGGFREFGLTDVNGIAAREVFDGKAVEFYAEYNRTRSAKQLVPIVSGLVATFETTQVTLAHSESVLYGITKNSGWTRFESPEEMFPGTYAFKFGNVLVEDFAVSGCAMNQAVNILKVKDHTGAPIAGATARGGFGNSFGTWHVPRTINKGGAVTTDASGVIIDYVNATSAPGLMSYEMKVNGTTAVLTQDVTINSVFEFQTSLLTLRLETCGGAPLDGGKPRWGNGSVYGTRWFPANPGLLTGSSAPGEVAGEAFPGTYSFEMIYQGTADRQISVPFSGSGEVITFKTTAVTLGYPGSVSFGGSTGNSRWFNKPTMELLPGTTRFHFRPYGSYAGYTTDLVVGGCTLNQTLVAVAVDDCAGGYLPGVDVWWHAWGASANKFPAGTTTAAGPLSFLIDGQAYPNIAVGVTYKDANLKIGPQAVATNPFFVFTAQTAVVDLQDHTGADIPMDASNNLRFYAYGNSASKHDMAIVGGNGQQCLLPGNYVFNVEYNIGRAASPSHNIATPYVFQTGAVVNGTFDATQYYLYGASANKGTFYDNIELLPNKYRFIGTSTLTAEVVGGQVLTLGDLIAPLSAKLEQTGVPGN